jgi:hypothetical protein
MYKVILKNKIVHKQSYHQRCINPIFISLLIFYPLNTPMGIFYPLNPPKGGISHFQVLSPALGGGLGGQISLGILGCC